MIWIARATAAALGVLVLSFAFATMAADSPARTDVDAINAAINQIRAESDGRARERLAQKLMFDVMKSDRSLIDASTIDGLASLLDDSNDDVHSKIAMALAAIEASAKRAAPALIRSLEAAKEYHRNARRPALAVDGFDNIFAVATSVNEICYAIQQIGSEAPGCVDGYYEDPPTPPQ